MTRKMGVSLSIAATSFAFIFPALAQAGVKSSQNDTTADSSVAAPGASEAKKMVPALAALSGVVDAKTAGPGQPIQAVLHGKVKLKDGTQLPSGTVLTGAVAKDDMQLEGPSKLALLFTSAKLKNGNIVPIKATIMGVYPPDNDVYEPWEDTGTPALQLWNSTVLQMDQIDALKGVDLRSDIASADSGVLVSHKKNDVKLVRGSELVLVIAPQSADQNGTTASGTM
jgi:hypothetical protein